MQYRFWIILIILVVINFIYSTFFYVDVPSGCFVTLLPSFNFSNGKVVDSIKVLKNASKQDYKDFCNRVSMIDPNVFCGGFEGGCYTPETPRRIYVDTSTNTLALIASVVVHETCHAKQDVENRNFDEPECYQAGYKVLDELTVYK